MNSAHSRTHRTAEDERVIQLASELFESLINEQIQEKVDIFYREITLRVKQYFSEHKDENMS
jgi:hypothetical protein